MVENFKDLPLPGHIIASLEKKKDCLGCKKWETIYCEICTRNPIYRDWHSENDKPQILVDKNEH